MDMHRDFDPDLYGLEHKDESGGEAGGERQDETDVAAAVARLQAGFDTKMAETDRELRAARERADALELRLNRPGGRGQAPISAEVKAFNTFVRHGREALHADETKALRVASDTSGGYLAPGEFSSEMLKNLIQYSPIREAARVGSMSVNEIKIPRRLQGVTARWVAEIETRQPSEPQFGMSEVVAHEMSAWVPVSNQLLEDSVFSVEAELSESFAEEFGRLEGRAFVLGTGIKQPYGLLTDPTVPIVPNGNASVLQTDALLKLLYALPPIYRNAGSWLLNGTTIATIRLLKDTTGRYLWQDSLTEGQPPTLLGRPVVEAIDMPDVAANATPIVYGDIAAAYRIYDRVGLSVLRDPYTLATEGQTRFLARRRVAGSVVRPEALRKLRISTT